MDGPKRPGLCLMAGSMSRDVLVEKEIRDYIVGEGVASGGRFVELLRSAQEAGKLPKEFEPAVVAQIIGAYIQGMSRAALISYDRPRIERQVPVFFEGFGLCKRPLPPPQGASPSVPHPSINPLLLG